MKKGILVAAALLTTLLSYAQSNLLDFTPSALFNKGQYEVNIFNNIYTQDAIRNSNGELQKLGQTQTFFNSMVQFTTGLSESSRFNVGLDVNISRARYDVGEAGPLKVFGSEGALSNRTVVSSIGPRIKFNPFKSIPRLSLQSTFLFPVASNQETPLFVAHDRYTWFTQLFFDQSLGNDFQIFLETDFLYRINRNSSADGNFFRVPLSAFLSYFPTTKSTLYVFGQYSPRFETIANSVDSQFGLSEWFTQVGLGGKYQVTQAVGLELSYSNFIASRMGGAGETINFGIRIIH